MMKRKRHYEGEQDQAFVREDVGVKEMTPSYPPVLHSATSRYTFHFGHSACIRTQGRRFSLMTLGFDILALISRGL